MRKKAELKLRGAALDKRISHHRAWSDSARAPFKVGVVVLIIADVFIFFDESHRLAWGLVILGSWSYAALALAIGSYHQKRYKVLEERVPLKSERK